jgi:hypothetical protein
MSLFDSSPRYQRMVSTELCEARSVTAFQTLTLAETTSPVIGSFASTMMPQGEPVCGF